MAPCKICDINTSHDNPDQDVEKEEVDMMSHDSTGCSSATAVPQKPHNVLHCRCMAGLKHAAQLASWSSN